MVGDELEDGMEDEKSCQAVWRGMMVDGGVET